MPAVRGGARRLRLGLAAAATLPWLLPVHHWALGPDVAGAPLAALLSAPDAAPLQLEELAARPLFLATRRPAVPGHALPAKPSLPAWMMPQPAAAPAAASADFVLLGTVLTPGTHAALIRDPSAPGARLIAEGQSLGAWTVQRVEADRIVLRLDGKTTELHFSRHAAVPPRAIPNPGLPPMAPPFFPTIGN